MHRDSILNNQATMPETMTKLLALGMNLQDIIKLSTSDPAKIINHPELGTLGQTAIADIAVLKVNKGDFGMTDNGTASRVMNSNKRITCEMTIKNGKVVWDRNGLSRDDWSTTPPTNPLL
jgi:dihydroorotase